MPNRSSWHGPLGKCPRYWRRYRSNRLCGHLLLTFVHFFVLLLFFSAGWLANVPRCQLGCTTVINFRKLGWLFEHIYAGWTLRLCTNIWSNWVTALQLLQNATPRTEIFSEIISSRKFLRFPLFVSLARKQNAADRNSVVNAWSPISSFFTKISVNKWYCSKKNGLTQFDEESERATDWRAFLRHTMHNQEPAGPNTMNTRTNISWLSISSVSSFLFLNFLVGTQFLGQNGARKLTHGRHHFLYFLVDCLVDCLVAM